MKRREPKRREKEGEGEKKVRGWNLPTFAQIPAGDHRLTKWVVKLIQKTE